VRTAKGWVRTENGVHVFYLLFANSAYSANYLYNWHILNAYGNVHFLHSTI
jgi:hypothetical protein